jgi:Flp pilus assembly protein TadD
MDTSDDALELALAHHGAGRLAEAGQLYRQILALDPGHAGALHLLGVIALQSGRPEEAVWFVRQAVARDPGQSVFYSNLGEAHRALGQLDEAKECYLTALGLAPDFAEAHNNLGLVLQMQGDFAAAQRHFERAIEIRPDNAEAHYNLARVLLLGGDYERGWPEYTWRERLRGHPSQALGLPRWDGTPTGDRLLLFAEQGLGDTLQFARYLPRVRERAPNAIVAVQPVLVPLLRSSGFTDVVPMTEAPPGAQWQCALAALPGLLDGAQQPSMADEPYLRAQTSRIEHWRDGLSGWPGFQVGIAWQGNPAYYSDRFRSIPLAQFGPIAALEGVRLISLQKGPGVEQLDSTGDRFQVVRVDDQLDVSEPFMDTAAIIAGLDLVVTSDTSIAHLAGAMGLRVWVALGLSPDWRWLLGRADSPWYPSMRLFRQTRLGDWSDVFQQIAEALAQHRRD